MRMTKRILLISCVSLLWLSGCGEKKELTEFKENMTTFYTEIAHIGEGIEGIAPDAETAVDSLLEGLAKLEHQFQFLADVQVPDEFISIEDLADDAADHMHQAVSYYRQAYEGEQFNESYAEAASKHYENAMKRVGYIASLLQGEIPEDTNVVVTNDGE